ncbi:MAG: hypothetical protein Q4C68_08660 [Moraxella sp.]|nr:hypothetical protein [Moraxella sp.]
MTDTLQTLSQVRAAIDAIDGELIELLARRNILWSRRADLNP